MKVEDFNDTSENPILKRGFTQESDDQFNSNSPYIIKRKKSYGKMRFSYKSRDLTERDSTP
jgi:hypothetical protein